MKKVLGTISLCILVTGCATGVNGERVTGVPGSLAWFSSASIPTQVAYFKQICAGYGIRDNTPQMTQCLQTEMRSARNRSQSMVNAIANSPTYNPAPVYSAPVITNCTGTGSTRTCISQ